MIFVFLNWNKVYIFEYEQSDRICFKKQMSSSIFIIWIKKNDVAKLLLMKNTYKLFTMQLHNIIYSIKQKLIVRKCCSLLFVLFSLNKFHYDSPCFGLLYEWFFLKYINYATIDIELCVMKNEFFNFAAFDKIFHFPSFPTEDMKINYVIGILLDAINVKEL